MTRSTDPVTPTAAAWPRSGIPIVYACFLSALIDDAVSSCLSKSASIKRTAGHHNRPFRLRGRQRHCPASLRNRSWRGRVEAPPRLRAYRGKNAARRSARIRLMFSSEASAFRRSGDPRFARTRFIETLQNSADNSLSLRLSSSCLDISFMVFPPVCSSPATGL